MQNSSLSQAQLDVEQRLRTVSQCLCGLAVIAAGLYYLRAILIPLVLAVALKYLLQPLIRVLAVRPLRCCGRELCSNHLHLLWLPTKLRPCVSELCQCRLPYWLAVTVALSFAFGVLVVLGFVVADSVRVFTTRAGE